MQMMARYTWCVVLFCFIPSTLGAPTFPTAVVMHSTFSTGCIAWICCSDWQLNCQPESLGAVPPHTVCTDSEGSGLCQLVDPVRGGLLYVSVCICKCKNCKCKHLHLLLQGQVVYLLYIAFSVVDTHTHSSSIHLIKPHGLDSWRNLFSLATKA